MAYSNARRKPAPKRRTRAKPRASAKYPAARGRGAKAPAKRRRAPVARRRVKAVGKVVGKAAANANVSLPIGVGPLTFHLTLPPPGQVVAAAQSAIGRPRKAR